jgi:L-fucono-1,5-lactonase
MSRGSSPIVDAHHHFWDPSLATYPWMTGTYEVLNRPYGPSDLAPNLEATGVTATIAVQARQELDETRFLLETAAATDWIAGVIGWVDLTAPTVTETIAEILEGRHGVKLVGIRHLVHDEADPDWLARDDVTRGLSAVASAGLAYDLLVRPRELPTATRVARSLPQLRFVVDHLAKPPVATGEIEPWASLMAEIAELPNVACKVSGLVTEADWDAWSPADLSRYIENVVEMFGPDRLMFGSDWPVCTLAADYTEVFEVTVEILSELVGDDLDLVLGECAREVYRLPM